MAPKTARNWKRERFSRYIRRLETGARRRRPGAGEKRYSYANRARFPAAKAPAPGNEPVQPYPRRLALGPLRLSCDPLDADELSEDHALQRLRCRHAGVTSASADGERLKS